MSARPRPDPIQIYRALLPTADRLVPYLQMIDARRYYTNRGTLVEQLENRLRALIAGPQCAVITASSGTAALQGAILASAGRATAARPLAIIPGYTFVATAMAAEACGYQPIFVDVEREAWALDPVRLRDLAILDRVGVVVPVAPYGRVHDLAGWSVFRRDTGVQVVIDAAASFEALAADPNGLTGDVPVVVSFQATKSFSTGEGGAVIWSDVEGMLRTVQALNFGFLYRRESRSSGFNGKMSEYHAAVGLAGLDAWFETAAANAQLWNWYNEAAGGRVIVGPTVASNYALYQAESVAAAERVTRGLMAARIDHRFWYGGGVHREAYFARGDGVDLPHTESMAARLIGVPMFPGIERADIEWIVSVIDAAEAAG